MIEAILSNLYVIAGTIVMACFMAYLSWRNGRKARIADASKVFRSEFSDALRNLKNNKVATATVVREMHTRHLTAIEDFRPNVGWLSLKSFKASATEYNRQADAYSQQSPIEQFASEQGADAQAQRAALRKAIEKLLKHASTI